MSPIKYIDWQCDVFKDLPDFDTATLKYHYTNIAKSNWRKLGQDNLEITKRVVKMFMYNCRCVLTWMAINEGENPSINIFELLNQVKGLDDDIAGDINSLISYSKNNYSDDLDSAVIGSIKEWMRPNLETMMHEFPKKDNSKDLNVYNKRFFDIILPDYDDYTKWINGD